MKKVKVLLFSALLLTLINFGSILAAEQGVVQCGNDPSNPCGFGDICKTARNVMTIILTQIGTALAVALLTIGAIVLMSSGGNPERRSLGKRIIITTLIGLALAFGAQALISFILTTLGSIYGIGC